MILTYLVMIDCLSPLCPRQGAEEGERGREREQARNPLASNPAERKSKQDKGGNSLAHNPSERKKARQRNPCERKRERHQREQLGRGQVSEALRTITGDRNGAEPVNLSHADSGHEHWRSARVQGGASPHPYTQTPCKHARRQERERYATTHAASQHDRGHSQAGRIVDAPSPSPPPPDKDKEERWSTHILRQVWRLCGHAIRRGGGATKDLLLWRGLAFCASPDVLHGSLFRLLLLPRWILTHWAPPNTEHLLYYCVLVCLLPGADARRYQEEVHQSSYSRVLLQQVLVSTVEPLVAPVHGGTVSMGMAAAET